MNVIHLNKLEFAEWPNLSLYKPSKATDCVLRNGLTLGEDLGEGTFGKVRLGLHLPTKERVAVKILEKEKIVDESDIERITREI